MGHAFTREQLKPQLRTMKDGKNYYKKILAPGQGTAILLLMALGSDLNRNFPLPMIMNATLHDKGIRHQASRHQDSPVCEVMLDLSSYIDISVIGGK